MTEMKHSDYERIVKELHKLADNKYGDVFASDVYIMDTTRAISFKPSQPHFVVRWTSGSEENGDNPQEFAQKLMEADELCKKMNAFFKDVTVIPFE